MSNAKTIDRICEIIARYEKLPKGFNDVSALIDGRKLLATLLFQYANEVGELYQEKLGAEFLRKSAFERKRTGHIESGDSATAAEAKAKGEIFDEMKDEMMADGLHKRADLLRQHAGDVLNAMNQHIASLKDERRLETQAQGSQQR